MKGLISASCLTLLAILLAGCGGQPYEDIKVWTSTNMPTADGEYVSIPTEGEVLDNPKHRICIQSDNARLQDLVRRVAEHEKMSLRFEAEVGNAFCTVNLSDVEPVAALESIVAMHDCVIARENGVIIIRNEQTDAQTTVSTTGGVFRTGLMYWAPERPLLCKDWRVVVAGTVKETHVEKTRDHPVKELTHGTAAIEKILLKKPTPKQEFVTASTLKSDGFDGLNRGDKVIVFVDEYDGGYGIQPVIGSNCRIGIKVESFDDPIVGAIEKMIEHLDARHVPLQDNAYAELWRKYSAEGVRLIQNKETKWQDDLISLPATHLPQKGETLSSIAKKYYGTRSKEGLQAILKANPWISNDPMKNAGKKLAIPKLEEPIPATDFSPNPAPFDAVAIVKSPVIMKGIYGSRSPGARGNAMARYGGAGSTEGAVIRCLRWLTKTQNEDGSWSGDNDPKTLATGIALLPFLGHGETPASPEFGKTVQKAMEFLLSMQAENGTFKGTTGDPALEHAIITFALCETYGLTRVPKVKLARDKAVALIIKGQSASGLWGTEYGKMDNLESSVWQIRALRSALISGYSQDELKPVLQKAGDALKGTIEADSKDKKTGPAVCCLQLLGYGREPVCKAGIEALAGLTMDWKNPGFDDPVYHWHFITQAKFHSGGQHWVGWNKSFAPELVKVQQVLPAATTNRAGKPADCGFWTSPGKGERYGKIYATALSCMMLQNYYAYLPTYKKPVDVREEKEDETREAKDIEIDIK